MFAKYMKMGGAAGLLLSSVFLPATAAVDSGTGTHKEEYLGSSNPGPAQGSKGGSTEAVGTQPEEYGNPPTPKAKPPKAKVQGTPGNPAKIQASEKAKHKAPPSPPPPKPGTQPGEYQAGGSGKVAPFDTVRKVRVRKEGAPPESVIVPPPKRSPR